MIRINYMEIAGAVVKWLVIIYFYATGFIMTKFTFSLFCLW